MVIINKEIIIKETRKYVEQKLQGEGSGHDWWHVYRVWKSAINIGELEGADIFIVELAALLHDVADWKFNDGDEEAGPREASKLLQSLGVEEQIIDKVCTIIRKVSFKGANVKNSMDILEGKVVQDADRLDAIGAIGIARTFAYGGFKNREIYNPNINPIKHNSFEEYKSSIGPTINHFYEKLLLLKDMMNTDAAKQLAVKRHEFMEEYLNRFYKEWDGLE